MDQIRCLAGVALVGALMMPGSATAQKKTTEAAGALPCGDYLSFQVLLDAQGFSVGEIDGRPGPNFSRAVAAMRSARALQSGGEADCDAWHSLGGHTKGVATVAYTITEDDVKGPFVKAIPRALPKQAALPALGYTSVLEKLAEKFHASPALLRRLNPGVRFVPNTEIQVPAVQPFDAGALETTSSTSSKQSTPSAPDAVPGDITVTVSRDESALRVTRADGTLVFFAPVTTGSEHDPLPPGDWKVTGVSWMPPFHYNPDLFWDAAAKDTEATLKPGPNNPVGVVWIDVNIEHYGLHGTPEPGRIAHTESHGCVRMTNWDAAKVAALVRPGTPVQFK
jgi:lipoprotein-anchoring transpeptidase ErfK/SrfK